MGASFWVQQAVNPPTTSSSWSSGCVGEDRIQCGVMKWPTFGMKQTREKGVIQHKRAGYEIKLYATIVSRQISTVHCAFDALRDRDRFPLITPDGECQLYKRVEYQVSIARIPKQWGSLSRHPRAHKHRNQCPYCIHDAGVDNFLEGIFTPFLGIAVSHLHRSGGEIDDIRGI
jgi:hypothetical protein